MKMNEIKEVYILLETEDEEILDTLGIFVNREDALQYAQDCFIDRGFDIEENDYMFENDYKIEKHELIY